MRKIGGLEIALGWILMGVSLFCGFLTALGLRATDLWIFQSEVLLWISGYLVFLTVEILRSRLFFHFFPLPEGEIPMGSRAEFFYHLYIVQYLMVFNPLTQTKALPVPIRTLLFQALGAKMGSNSFSNGVLNEPPLIEIGNNTLVGASAMLIPHAIEGTRLSHEKIKLGSNVTIGANAVILQGVVIEDDVVIAVGSVVSKGTHIPRGEIWGGIPARCLKKSS
jgi:hypothetical protein